MKFVIKLSAKKDHYYFILKAKNGETIATSEMYNSKYAVKKGINAVKRSFFARIEDLTF